MRRHSSSGILQHIFNLSLKLSVFPFGWKNGLAISLFKSGNTTYVRNYRPIFLFAVFSKVFEKIIEKGLAHPFTRVIPDAQHGFMRGCSVETNLVCSFNDLAPTVCFFFSSRTNGCCVF